ncbi:hypothetical protein L873DRAFT_1817576 [Choiromyces venosus 120613-1]|uniref:Uncharacterized protein n=1 Tax=Choiromyces venosus 120613-1 TaxID=1336337 RepID=A0A3N4J2W1_9PEZI|nr:hypothetical protein L873DRAFT_1817576 [Choiromyces venosus 120613-1]
MQIIVTSDNFWKHPTTISSNILNVRSAVGNNAGDRSGLLTRRRMIGHETVWNRSAVFTFLSLCKVLLSDSPPPLRSPTPMANNHTTATVSHGNPDEYLIWMLDSLAISLPPE